MKLKCIWILYKLIYFKFLMPLNIDSPSVIFSILKLDISRNFKDSHPENIELILVTDEVSKVDKSKNSNEEQFKNILLISTIFEVSKKDKSTYFNELHPENIEVMFPINDVLKWEKSIDVILAIFGSISELKNFSKLSETLEKYITIFDSPRTIKLSLAFCFIL